MMKNKYLLGLLILSVVSGFSQNQDIRRSGISSEVITNGLGYTPVNKAGDTMTGVLVANVDTPLLSLGDASTNVVVDFSTLGFRTMNATNDLSISVTNMPSGVVRTLDYIIYTGTTNRTVTWQTGLTNSMGAPLPSILPSNNIVNLTLRSIGTAVTNVTAYVSWRIP